MFRPAYITLYNEGKLSSIISSVENIYRNCTLCPHACMINRLEGNHGKCNCFGLPVLSSAGPHFGEEPPLVGMHGSGTVFFSHCNLKCIFCQNYDISQLQHGQEITFRQLADTMHELQQRGCHNINFVTPTHQIYAILKALELAIPEGLKIPLVYNSGGYDSVSTLKILEGIFDIYMPDFKYYFAESAKKLCGASNYPQVTMKAIQEMHRQVGNLMTDQTGVAKRGLIIRHLILPNHIEESKQIIDFIADLSSQTYFNLMDQYRPEFKAIELSEINRRLSSEEYDELFKYATKKGLHLAE